jgi:transposase-like protein
MRETAKPPECPNCNGQMKLVRLVPKVMGLPELQSFKCGECNEVLTREAPAD